MQHRLREMLARLALIAAALAIAFVVGELAVRGLERFGVLADPREGALFEIVEHAGKSRMSENEILFWEPDPDHPMINADGFRDRDYDVGKSDAVRIVVLGDSVTFGRGVPLEGTYVKLLEERLNREERGGLRYEVLNLGVSGYNSRQQLEFYETKGRKYEPDLIVIGFVLNDTLPANRQLEALAALADRRSGKTTQEQADWREFRKRWRTDPRFRESMNQLRSAVPDAQWEEHAARRKAAARKSPGGSRLIALVRDRLKRLRQEAQVGRHPWVVRSYSNPKTWRIVGDSFAGFSRISAKDGVPVLVVIFPLLTDFEDYAFVSIHEKVANEARERGLEVLDLYERFRGEDAESFRQSGQDTVHPNAQGHRSVAQWIYEHLVASGLLRKLEPRGAGAE
jgi:lysophospholipase L1-like esterase